MAKEALNRLDPERRLNSTYGDDTRLFAAAFLDSRGGFLSINGTGVGVFIPAGALSDEVFVYLYVAQDAKRVQGLEERDGDVLSPLVSCGPPGLLFNQKVYYIGCFALLKSNIGHMFNKNKRFLNK